MNGAHAAGSPRHLAFAIVLLFVATASLAWVVRDLASPGLYYDEVIQAEPAVQFLSERGVPSAVPGSRTIRLFGGWFPVAIQPYMGALKSQILIPVFAWLGPDAVVLRGATLALAGLGVLLSLLWIRDLYGGRVAWAAALLLVSDPSLLFIARHDWGSFSIGLLCRGGALLLLTRGWTRGSALRLFGGGLLLGLGVYNKIDFGVFVFAAGLVWIAVARRAWALPAGEVARRAGSAASGALLGAAPVIAGAAGVWSATRNAVRREAQVTGDWGEKLQALQATLDGSYFQKLILAGGSFERMDQTTGAAAGLLGVAFALASLALGVWLWRERRSGRRHPAEAFALAAAWAVAAALFVTPRAVRIHHFLNLVPFPQLVVAVAAVRWGARRAGAPSSARRWLAAAALVAVVAANLFVVFETVDTVERTDGKGRWSGAIGEFAVELAARPGAVAVPLDWGFAGPMRFASRELPVVEPIWALRDVGRTVPAWHMEGGADHVYLAFEDDLAVFEFGPRFLALARDLSAGPDPGVVAVRHHPDREGDPAFVSVRFARPHRLTYRGDFEVEWR